MPKTKDLDGGATGRRCLKREREMFLRRGQRFRGLNIPGPMPGQTMSGLTGHCLAEPDFV
jgi:hypothetical protein